MFMDKYSIYVKYILLGTVNVINYNHWSIIICVGN